ncbi:guanine nucleotide-binding protein beta subunit [Reticulomyxa filosa]|uniref:Guanine nucleotide-binding protein beta subunit n=1 Tax=Reticulomyxa filosa TaxID=46433 RepID=X6LY79_RETFI|nr:guanine nucleotide-binding protein beta subunit [Reticulomyxa filosa]|eukprot:ETO06311.1 guanine nucleotide-binding protein beta subunit [Reticulomyxa filosa]
MLQFLNRVVNINEELKECNIQLEQLKEAIKKKRQILNTFQTYVKTKQLKTPKQKKLKQSKIQLKGHFGTIRDINWCHDNKHLLSAARDGKLLIWDTVTAMKKKLISFPNPWIVSCAFSPGGNFIASGASSGICTICDVSDLNSPEAKPVETQIKCELIGHNGYLSCCKFIDENTIITTSGDSTVGCWNIEKEHMVDIFLGHRGDVMSVAVDLSSRLCITVSADATAKVWDHRTPKRWILDFSGFHQNDINCVQFFPNKHSFVTGSSDASCRLFDLRAYQQMAIYQNNMQDPISTVDVSVSGHYIFAGCENLVLVWDVIHPESSYQLQHHNKVPRLQVSPSGHVVATGSWDCMIHLWS